MVVFDHTIKYKVKNTKVGTKHTLNLFFRQASQASDGRPPNGIATLYTHAHVILTLPNCNLADGLDH